MPVISRFLGITISMLYRDHDPPHFHASYGEFEVLVEILTGKMRGSFPRRAGRMVREWRTMHESALLENWDRARDGRPLASIPPLE